MRFVEKVVGLGVVALFASCTAERDPEVATAEQFLCSSATSACTCGGGGDAYSNNRGTDGSCSDPNISTNQLAPTVSAIETAGDVDWFRFTTSSLSGSYTYTFNTDRSGVTTTDTYCDIYSSATGIYAMRYNNNDPLNPGDAITGGANCLVSLTTNLPNRTYYVRVRHASAAGTGAYALYMVSGPAGVGDACATDADCGGASCVLGSCTALLGDTDGDGIPESVDGNSEDNCPGVANEDQADSDCDGAGDACDNTSNPTADCVPAEADMAPADSDADGIDDSGDNCINTANADQADLDADGQGDACDTDDDGDGVADDVDNCPVTPNADQANADGDAYVAGLADTGGDACDNDDDADGVNDASDNCVGLTNSDQANNDGDAQGDACDADDDNDGIGDGSDNCPNDSNADQKDSDFDGIGNVCDADADGDGVLNESDVCADSPGNVPVSHDPASAGCTGAQLIALLCACDGFASHGDYVSCVSNAADHVRDMGLISTNEVGRHVRAAAQSSCGQ